MKVVVQKCLHSSVMVNDKEISSIDKGLNILVAFTNTDTIDTIKWMVNKVLNLRIFNDENNVMNLSVLDVKGEILSVSQFTLYGDCKKGNRPSYINSMASSKAIEMYDIWNKLLSEHISVKTGEFGADMVVNIVNDGPTTIIIER